MILLNIDQLLDHIAVHIGQSTLDAVVVKSQLPVIDP
jgi:hypothetical protein